MKGSWKGYDYDELCSMRLINSVKIGMEQQHLRQTYEHDFKSKDKVDNFATWFTTAASLADYITQGVGMAKKIVALVKNLKND